MKSIYGQPTCIYCNTTMNLKNYDRHFKKWCINEYHLCPKCQAGLFRKIRYEKICYNSYRWINPENMTIE